MRYSDWKMIATFGYILGILSLVGAFIAFFYYEESTSLFGSIVRYPYGDYTIPLLMAGIVLMVIGYVTEQRAKEDIQLVGKQQLIPDIGFCPNCGTKKDLDAQYCKKCGKKFE